MKRTLLVLAATGALALTSACESTRRVAWQTGLPFVSAEFHVVSVERRAGQWLDTRLTTGNITRRVLVPDDATCRGMLVEGGTVDWARSEPFGPLAKGDLRCSVVGLGDLETWRDVRSRRASTSGPIRSARTRFQIVRQDEQFTYARGGFSLARYLGWTPGTDQVIALLPRGPECDSARPGVLITMEYRVSGRPAFSLRAPDGRCPIDAVIAAPRTGTEPAPEPDQELEPEQEPEDGGSAE